MAEVIKSRIKFLKGDQRKFLLLILKSKDIETLANALRLSQRTIRDWRREKFLMPYETARFLSKKYRVRLPKNFEIKQEFWYTSKGAKKGGFASFRKQGGVIGDSKIRLQKWHEWWEREGEFQKRTIFCRKLIAKPQKNSRLAEFTGIMLGDGGITKNQVTVTLNRKTDCDYVIYVKNLIENLFGVKPSLIKDKFSLAVDLVISRVELVDFCRGIGLKVGNKIKQEADVPEWIKENQGFMRLCVRGLVDTDGSVFIHKYRVNRKLYRYAKIDFSSYSKPLLSTVFIFLKKLRLRPRILKDGRKLRIESVDTVKKYMKVIGTSNPKHLKKYLKWHNLGLRGGVA